MVISERKLRTLESGEREVTPDEIVEFARLYKVICINKSGFLEANYISVYLAKGII